MDFPSRDNSVPWTSERERRLAREATELASQTDFLNIHANALTDLAAVLELAGERKQAAAAAQTALALYERKGNVVMAERTRERLTELRKRAT